MHRIASGQHCRFVRSGLSNHGQKHCGIQAPEELAISGNNFIELGSINDSGIACSSSLHQDFQLTSKPSKSWTLHNHRQD